MPLDHQKIINKVREEHGILLSMDDPVLATLSVHEEILSQYSGMLESSMHNLSAQIEEINFRHIESSREIAQKIIGSAVKFSTEEINRTAENAATQISTMVNNLLEEIRVEQQKARRQKIIFGTAAILTMLFSLGLIMVFFFF